MCGNSAYDWNTMLTSRSFAARNVTSVPPIAMRPADTGSSDFGTGTFLRGVFGVNSVNSANVMPLAYLVLSADEKAALLAQLADTIDRLKSVTPAQRETLKSLYRRLLGL